MWLTWLSGKIIRQMTIFCFISIALKSIAMTWRSQNMLVGQRRSDQSQPKVVRTVSGRSEPIPYGYGLWFIHADRHRLPPLIPRPTHIPYVRFVGTNIFGV